jgi:AcrR family transcriptional regulator
MTTSIQKRKRILVRDTIWDAAIALFDKRGFEQTTVDDIAKAAGVSRRSFFRYFSCKDDLLAQGMITYGEWLGQAIEACPRNWTVAEVIRKATADAAEMITAQPRTRQVIRILDKSAAARHAQDSPMSIVEYRVTKAFSSRLRARGKNDFKPRLLALVTLSIMKAAVSVWSRSDRENMRAVIREALPILHQALS